MNGRVAWLALAVATGAALLPAAGPLRGEESCGVCHPEERVLAEGSIHASEGVGCRGCHGGDPTSVEEREAHRGGYRALDDRKEIPGACARCHSDLEMMRPFDLPIDQLALYQTSQHGRALAAGDDKVAVCVDCHGVHDVREPADPLSPVNWRNVAETCGRCHSDQALMEPYGHDAELVHQYSTSVHGAAAGGGVEEAPTCINCHGVHGAAPPGVGDIDKVCGACHVATRRAFLEGPHREAMLAADLPECESCHSNHGIVTFGMESLGELCLDCHDEGSEASSVGRQIEELVAAATAEIDSAEELTLVAQRVPLDVNEHRARLVEARAQLIEARSLAHAVSVEPVRSLARRALSIGEEVERDLDAKMDRTNAHIGLVIFWFYLAMALAILFVTKRRLRRQRARR